MARKKYNNADLKWDRLYTPANIHMYMTFLLKNKSQKYLVIEQKSFIYYFKLLITVFISEWIDTSGLASYLKCHKQ